VSHVWLDLGAVGSTIQALKDADFVYAKNWSSYIDYGKIGTEFTDWTITKEKMDLTNDGKFMHCLPVGRGEEVTDEIIDGSQSVVWRQALNRVHAQKSIIKWCLD
jgi:N-succinyl-L-ornithine transcarbamylase